MRGRPGGVREESNGHGFPEGTLRENREGSWQISLVSTMGSLGSQTQQETQGEQQRKVEKGSLLLGW